MPHHCLVKMTWRHSQLNSKASISHWIVSLRGVNLFIRSLYSCNQHDSGMWPKDKMSVQSNQALPRQKCHWYPVEPAHYFCQGIFSIMVLSELSFWKRRSRTVPSLHFKGPELILRLEDMKLPRRIWCVNQILCKMMKTQLIIKEDTDLGSHHC
jgi:hypothetical protein